MTSSFLVRLSVLTSALFLAAPASAQSPPRYTATFLGEATVVNDLSETGTGVGQVYVGNATRGWVASATAPMQLLPLAPGDGSSWALDVAETGTIVGSLSTSTTSPEFGGRAVAWQPDGLGGYTIVELGKLPGHLGAVATAVNNLGDILGYSRTGMFRYPVWFNSPGGIMDLNPFGVFDPQSINDQRQFCDRTGRRMDLDTLVVEDLGLPSGPTGYGATTGYAINSFGQVAGTAVLATSTSCVYQAARYVDGVGWQILTNCSPHANAHDINDHGDTLYQATQIEERVRFEGLGEHDPESLLAPSAAQFDLLTSFRMAINDARQLLGIATDTLTGQTGAVLLDPIGAYQADVGFGGPGPMELSAFGGDLSSGTTVDVTLVGAPAFTDVFVVLAVAGNPLPFKGGTLVALPFALATFPTGSAGTFVVPGIKGGGGPASIWVQCLRPDADQPEGFSFSNAVRLDFQP